MQPSPLPANELASAVVAVLIELGRPGARLVASELGHLIEYRSRTRQRRFVDAECVAATRTSGYLRPDPTFPKAEILSVEGRFVLRNALMQKAARTGDRRVGRPESTDAERRCPTERAVPPSALAVSAIPQRSSERMSVVDLLRLRKDGQGQSLLTEPQYQAAQRLARDFQIAQMQPRITALWTPVAPAQQRRRSAPGAGVELAAETIAAQGRVRGALAAAGGALADLVLDVCCFDRGLESIEATRRWPKRTARIMLGLALTELARHYGLIYTAPNQAHGVPRHWGDADFKPSAEAWLKR